MVKTYAAARGRAWEGSAGDAGLSREIGDEGAGAWRRAPISSQIQDLRQAAAPRQELFRAGKEQWVLLGTLGTAEVLLERGPGVPLPVRPGNGCEHWRRPVFRGGFFMEGLQ